MKCGECGQEVALAKVCPYCGSRVNQESREEGGQTHDRPRGEFRGRVGDENRRRYGPERTLPGIGQIVRFLVEPRVAPWQKGLFLAALFYVLSPIDLFPGAFLPIIGWFDDLAVIAMALRFVASRLDHLDRT